MESGLRRGRIEMEMIPRTKRPLGRQRSEPEELLAWNKGIVNYYYLSDVRCRIETKASIGSSSINSLRLFSRVRNRLMTPTLATRVMFL